MSYAIYQLTRNGQVDHEFISRRSPGDVMIDVVAYLLDEVDGELATPEKLRELLTDVKVDTLQVIDAAQEVLDIDQCLKFMEAKPRLFGAVKSIDESSTVLMTQLACAIGKVLDFRFSRYWLEAGDDERQERTAWLNRLAAKAVFHMNAIEQTYSTRTYQRYHDAFFGKTTTV